MLDFNDADGAGEQADAAADDGAALQQAAEAAAEVVKTEEAAGSAAAADAMQTTTEVSFSLARSMLTNAKLHGRADMECWPVVLHGWGDFCSLGMLLKRLCMWFTCRLPQ